MNKLLLQFFAINKKISIPGIGTLSVKTESSEDNFGTKTIIPSINKIVFDKNVDEQTKQSFESFAAQQRQKNDKEIHRFYHQLSNTLASTNRVNLDGLGILENDNGNIYFKSVFASSDFYSSIAVEKVIREDAEHTIQVGEQERTSTQMREALSKNESKKYWWVYVLIVLLIGVAGYFFYTYYFQK